MKKYLIECSGGTCEGDYWNYTYLIEAEDETSAVITLLEQKRVEEQEIQYVSEIVSRISWPLPKKKTGHWTDYLNSGASYFKD